MSNTKARGRATERVRQLLAEWENEPALRRRFETQAAVAREIGVTEEHLSRLKKEGVAGAKVLHGLARAFGIRFEFFTDELTARPVIRDYLAGPLPLQPNGAVVIRARIVAIEALEGSECVVLEARTDARVCNVPLRIPISIETARSMGPTLFKTVQLTVHCTTDEVSR